MTHSHPTPWRVVNMDEENIEDWYEIVDANGKTVVDFIQERTGTCIVAAVNEREELLEALHEWEGAYPVEVFAPVSAIETKTAVEALTACGVSSERLHASWARHIIRRLLDRIDKEAKNDAP